MGFPVTEKAMHHKPDCVLLLRPFKVRIGLQGALAWFAAQHTRSGR